MAELPRTTQQLRELMETVHALVGLVSATQVCIDIPGFMESPTRGDLELAKETLKLGIMAAALVMDEEGVDKEFFQFRGDHVTACGHHGLSGHELTWRIAISIQQEIKSYEKLARKTPVVDLWLRIPGLLLDRYSPFPAERLDVMLRNEGLAWAEIISEGGNLQHSANPTNDTKDKFQKGARGQKQKQPVKLKNWALAHDGQDWRWFQFAGNLNKLIERGQANIPRGNPDRLARKLAELGGGISRTSVVSLFRTGAWTTRSSEDVFEQVVKPAKLSLSKTIKAEISRIATQNVEDDPLPYNRSANAYQSEIQFGYAVKDDDDELVFKIRDEMLP